MLKKSEACYTENSEGIECMLRFYFVIIINIWRALYYIPKMRYLANRKAIYSPEMRNAVGKEVIHHMQRSGRIHTTWTGTELLPRHGGYVMYANHQGKYDALGIFDAHEKPMSFVIDENRSHMMLTAQFVDMTESKRLVRTDLRQGMQIMKEVAREVAQDHKKFLIFPEGGYDHNQNMVQEFKGGSFKCAMKAKAPIVPVALVNSHKVFDGQKLHRVDTQVHFLKPLYYEDYKELKATQVAELVRDRIQQCILDHLQGDDLEILKGQLAGV